MDALAVGAEIGGIIGGIAVVVGLTVWLWREREQTRRSIEALDTRITWLSQAAATVSQTQPELTARLDAIEKQIPALTQSSDDGRTTVLSMLRDYAELRQQVAAIEKSTDVAAKALLDHIAGLRSDLNGLQATVAQLGIEMDERNEAFEKQAQLISYFQVNLNDIDMRLTPLEAHVKDLSNGIMPRVGGTHTAE